MPTEKQQKNWIVRDGDGKIYGPFTTEQVLVQIDRGYFVGGEEVALYPGGRWIAISGAPEFYDRLLDALAMEGQSAKASSKKKAATQAAAPSPPPPPRSQRSFLSRLMLFITLSNRTLKSSADG